MTSDMDGAGLGLRLFCASVGCVLLSGCGSDDGGGSDSSSFPAPVADECITDVSAGAHDYACDGLKYTVSVADRCLHKACGVILDVHGWFMTGADEERETGLAARGNDNGYLVIQPTANIGPARGPFPEAPSWNHDVDAPKLYTFLERAIAAWHVDQKRVHVTGFSQGGMMTWRFLCEHSDELASVAPGGANAGYGTVSASGICRDGSMPSEIPILYMHGHTDALVPFAGAAQARDVIVSAFGMTGPENVAGDTGFTWSRWTAPGGNVFEFIEHDYASSYDFLKGHCFPGGLKGSLLTCLGEPGFIWGEEVMKFFIAHPKQ